MELYNLKEDIGEQTDLSSNYPEKTAELLKLLHEWQQEVEARMPTINPGYQTKEK